MRLDGRHTLVTGGLDTIRQAPALAFREAGTQVTVLDRPDLVPPEEYGWLPVDLGDLRAPKAAVAAAGPFDILVNNAALIINKPHEAFSLEEYEEQVRVNSSAGLCKSNQLRAACIALPLYFLGARSMLLGTTPRGASGDPPTDCPFTLPSQFLLTRPPRETRN